MVPNTIFCRAVLINCSRVTFDADFKKLTKKNQKSIFGYIWRGFCPKNHRNPLFSKNFRWIDFCSLFIEFRIKKHPRKGISKNNFRRIFGDGGRSKVGGFKILQIGDDIAPSSSYENERLSTFWIDLFVFSSGFKPVCKSIYLEKNYWGLNLAILLIFFDFLKVFRKSENGKSWYLNSKTWSRTRFSAEPFWSTVLG